MRKKHLLAALSLALVLTVAGCGGDSTEASQDDAEQAEATYTIDATTLDELISDMNEAIADTEPNSSERVDAIAFYAKDAAATKNEDIGNEAVLFIVNEYPNYFESSEVMEKALLCGYYLEYLDYAERVTQIGQDVEQAVKYVYRGVETAEDDATKENLAQIKEIIDTSDFG